MGKRVGKPLDLHPTALCILSQKVTQGYGDGDWKLKFGVGVGIYKCVTLQSNFGQVKNTQLVLIFFRGLRLLSPVLAGWFVGRLGFQTLLRKLINLNRIKINNKHVTLESSIRLTNRGHRQARQARSAFKRANLPMRDLLNTNLGNLTHGQFLFITRI